MNDYQENIYLLILDNRAFSFQLDFTTNELRKNLVKSKKELKTVIYIFLFFNLFVSIIIIIFIFGYIIMFFIITIEIIKNINIYLNEKNGDIKNNEIIKKKIDNLKILLSFYENDIDSSISELNFLYSHYRENYNLKMKEESKLLRKENRNEIEDSNKKVSCFSIFKKVRINKLFIYSGRKNSYLYSFSVLIIFILIFNFITIVNWIYFFKKDDTISNWVELCDGLVSTTNKLMTNFYLMIYNNQTLDEISHIYNTKDFASYAYNDLLNLYDSEKYLKSIKDISSFFNEQNIIYDCNNFYQNMKNDFFYLLKKEYQNEEFKFLFTIYYFCNWSNVMKFKNFKTIFLQLFSQLKTVMEDFNNINYNDIIEYINNIDIVKIEIIFLITYIYLFDIMFNNIKISTMTMMSIMGDKIFFTGSVLTILVIYLIIVMFFVYIKNIDKDFRKFIQIRKIFKICNTNE